MLQAAAPLTCIYWPEVQRSSFQNQSSEAWQGVGDDLQRQTGDRLIKNANMAELQRVQLLQATGHASHQLPITEPEDQPRHVQQLHAGVPGQQRCGLQQHGQTLNLH